MFSSGFCERWIWLSRALSCAGCPRGAAERGNRLNNTPAARALFSARLSCLLACLLVRLERFLRIFRGMTSRRRGVIASNFAKLFQQRLLSSRSQAGRRHQPCPLYRGLGDGILNVRRGSSETLKTAATKPRATAWASGNLSIAMPCCAAAGEEDTCSVLRAALWY